MVLRYVAFPPLAPPPSASSLLIFLNIDYIYRRIPSISSPCQKINTSRPFQLQASEPYYVQRSSPILERKVFSKYIGI